MTDAEISRRLALAIGWQEKQNDPDVILELDWREDTAQCKVWFDGNWRTFDYRDPSVIWPIAERFNKWPRKEGNEWKCDPALTETVSADTAAKAN